VDRRDGAKGSQPVILQFTLADEDWANLRADDDWLEKIGLAKDMAAFKQRGWESLREFGQVGLDGVVPADRLKPLSA